MGNRSNNKQQRTQYSDPLLDDVNNFRIVDKDLANIGLTDDERFSIYNTIAVVLHLGNICFEDNPDDNRGGCMVTSQTEKALEITSKLMGLDQEDLRHGLTARIMQTNKGGNFGTVIMVPLKAHEASNARDALAKSLYSRLFDYIVMRINQSIPFEASRFFIGILDIAGFEYFTVNSFEQFCINYCNEKLQQFFNQRILKDEQDLYEKEGLGVKKISFSDNQDCIDLIEAKGNGIFGLLDEQSKLPKASSQQFTNAVHAHNKGHFRLALPRKSKLREHREIGDDDGFLIRHFAGAVCYTTSLFIEKNNVALHASLEALAHECQNVFIRTLFVLGGQAETVKGKLNFISVGNKFQKQLGELMDKLRSTGTNFIRCIKPNVKMVPHLFEGGSILSQLQCAGMTSVLKLMEQGYPSRTMFSELYTMYKKYLPPELARLDPRLFCKALFKALGLDDNDFKFGMTKVFFRPGKFAEFDQILKSDPENLRILIAKVKKWLLHSQWKKAQWCALSVIKLKNKIIYRKNALITIQKWVRMHLAYKVHAHRYKGILRLKKSQGQIEAIGSMASTLKPDAKKSVQANVKAIYAHLDNAIAKIRASSKISKANIDAINADLIKEINKAVADVKVKLEKQKSAEEQERLRKIQEEMEKERKRKEEEELKQKQLEEDRKIKAEMEVRRKEEENVNALVELERKKSIKKQAEMNEENRLLREQMEQERRDHELALRLARESKGGMDDTIQPMSSPVPKMAEVAAQVKGEARPRSQSPKYDLSNWKYAELRDTINTSCDIDLLEACREEFHRRLKVYHAWKSKNRKGGKGPAAAGNNEETMRAPSSVMAAASNTGAIAKGTTPNTNSIKGASNSLNDQQRYFKIPFAKPVEGQMGSLSPSHQAPKGWWYAHFDGDWIARQMEITPEAKPVLLVAGKDDMKMCELSLSETGLTRKRGAEVLENEFEKVWQSNGGRAYVRPSARGPRNATKN